MHFGPLPADVRLLLKTKHLLVQRLHLGDAGEVASGWGFEGLGGGLAPMQLHLLILPSHPRANGRGFPRNSKI